MANVQCPYCQSILEPQGNIDFQAPSISVVNCPVCGYPLWVPADFPIPHRWTGFRVINLQNPDKRWSDFVKANPQTAANLNAAPAEAADKGIYKDFSITKPIGELVGNVATGIGNAAGSGISGLFSGLIKSTGGIVLIGLVVIAGVLLLTKRK